jgi:hypothetical protein
LSYRLIAAGQPGDTQRDVGDNVLLADLADEFKVYAFYYGAGMPNLSVIQALRTLGAETGKNLFINIGKLNDPQQDKIARMFGIEKYPVLVMTALSHLAASRDEPISAYVRLDNERLLNSPERTIGCVQELFSLFLQGKVAEAVTHAKWSQRAEFARAVGGVLAGALKKIGDFVLDRDFVFSFVEGTLTLKKSGD